MFTEFLIEYFLIKHPPWGSVFKYYLAKRTEPLRVLSFRTFFIID